MRELKKMDTREFAESSYVTAELIKTSPTKTATIIGDATRTEGEYKGKKFMKLEMPVEIDGKHKTYSPNRDGVKNIQAALGMESKNWIGKVLVFQVVILQGKETLLVSVKK